MSYPPPKPALPPTRALQNDIGAAIAAGAAAVAPEMQRVRRDLHAHPELAFQEFRTAGVIAGKLAELGIATETGVGRTGVVGTIIGGRPGKTLAIRADMDALPITEATGLAFASVNPGLMHACGHDIHSATLLGIAAVLRDLAPRLAGSVKLLFQPAEETLGGAAAMIADGALTGVAAALGFHNQPDLPVGRFAYVPGASLAAADTIEITLAGKSGHAAYPHTAIDPIMAAASLITQLQTIVSREVSPLRPVVVTIGAIAGGVANNIIPDSCVLRGTLRTLHAETRDQAEAAIRRISAGVATASRVRVDVMITRGVPPLVNNAMLTAPAVAALAAQFADGGDGVVRIGEPGMGAEDFALMADIVPAFQLRIGSGAPGRADRLHNSGYQPDEACMELGVVALSRMALELLDHLAE